MQEQPPSFERSLIQLYDLLRDTQRTELGVSGIEPVIDAILSYIAPLKGSVVEGDQPEAWNVVRARRILAIEKALTHSASAPHLKTITDRFKKLADAYVAELHVDRAAIQPQLIEEERAAEARQLAIQAGIPTKRDGRSLDNNFADAFIALQRNWAEALSRFTGTMDEEALNKLRALQTKMNAYLKPDATPKDLEHSPWEQVRAARVGELLQSAANAKNKMDETLSDKFLLAYNLDNFLTAAQKYQVALTGVKVDVEKTR